MGGLNERFGNHGFGDAITRYRGLCMNARSDTTGGPLSLLNVVTALPAMTHLSRGAGYKRANWSAVGAVARWTKYSL